MNEKMMIKRRWEPVRTIGQDPLMASRLMLAVAVRGRAARVKELAARGRAMDAARARMLEGAER